MKRTSKEARPLLVGEINGADIAVWCPHCKEYHYHGWHDENKRDTVEHRVAHCHDNESPYWKGGYFIGVAQKPKKFKR